MAEWEYKPVKHNHKEFLAKARARIGFSAAYDALELEYQVAGQMLKARARAGLTQDAVADADDGIVSPPLPQGYDHSLGS